MKDDLIFYVILCVMVVLILLFPILGGSGGTFSGRCTEAGYEGAELELCIKRVKEGLPVYKENIEKWNKGYCMDIQPSFRRY